MASLKVVAYLTFTITPLMLIYYIKKKFKQKLSTLDDVDTSNYKTLFLCNKNLDCRKHIYLSTPCSDFCSFHDLQFIIKYIDCAKHSISLCMYLLTSTEIQNSLVRLHNKGVKVRYVTDIVMAENPAAKIMYLKEQGLTIKVQAKRCDNLLHHKFCLVDENHPKNRKLFFGTLNLTIQGITSNFDTLIFTNNIKIIERYKDEFELLWASLKEV